MWEIDSLSQVLGFLYSAAFGSICCVAYDVLRAVRAQTKFSAVAVFVQDIVFSVVCAFACFCLLLSVTGGDMRIFVFVGIAVGFLACRLTLSRVLLFVYSKILKAVKWLFRKICLCLRAVFTFIDKSTAFLKKKTLKFCKFLSNMLKKLLKKK